MAIRNAKAKWTGTLREGTGVMNFSNYNGPFTFASRFETGEGTNPEELIGAAQAGCYSMFLSALISGDKLVPESIETTAKVTLGNDDIGPLITSIELDCQAKVPGITQARFDELAQVSKEKCPISRLLSKGTEVTLKATLL